MLVELTCGSVLSDAFAVSCGTRTEEGFDGVETSTVTVD